MSTFKLDFDISKVRAVPPKRRRPPKNPAQPPLLPTVVVPKEEIQPTSLFRAVEFFKTSSFKLLAQIILLLTLVLSLFSFVVIEGAFYAKEPKRFEGSCEIRADYLLCHGSDGCEIRGNCHFSRLIHFSSRKCALQIQTITTHSPGGDATQYPAHYLQYKNTSDFIVEGDRVLLHPVQDHACSATVRALPDNQFSREVVSQLQGSILWVTEKEYDRFIVQRDQHTLATVEEDVALFTVTEYYRLYKLDIACSTKHSGVVTVFGEAEASEQTKIDAFDFC